MAIEQSSQSKSNTRFHAPSEIARCQGQSLQGLPLDFNFGGLKAVKTSPSFLTSKNSFSWIDGPNSEQVLRYTNKMENPNNLNEQISTLLNDDEFKNIFFGDIVSERLDKEILNLCREDKGIPEYCPEHRISEFISCLEETDDSCLESLISKGKRDVIKMKDLDFDVLDNKVERHLYDNIVTLKKQKDVKLSKQEKRIEMNYLESIFDARDELGINVDRYNLFDGTEQFRYRKKGSESAMGIWTSREKIIDAAIAIKKYDQLLDKGDWSSLREAQNIARQYFTKEAKERAWNNIEKTLGKQVDSLAQEGCAGLLEDSVAKDVYTRLVVSKDPQKIRQAITISKKYLTQNMTIFAGKKLFKVAKEIHENLIGSEYVPVVKQSIEFAKKYLANSQVEASEDRLEEIMEETHSNDVQTQVMFISDKRNDVEIYDGEGSGVFEKNSRVRVSPDIAKTTIKGYSNDDTPIFSDSSDRTKQQPVETEYIKQVNLSDLRQKPRSLIYISDERKEFNKMMDSDNPQDLMKAIAYANRHLGKEDARNAMELMTEIVRWKKNSNGGKTHNDYTTRELFPPVNNEEEQPVTHLRPITPYYSSQVA
ncbi:hypothetical protein HQ545_07565 [Candidatus Woesearchaeota archaeon]|nr:hypothetical protein [Candidatus Woesearchaeota archaeon]